MSQSQEGDSSKRSKAHSFDDQEALGNLAECSVEILKKEIENESDPFESYERLLRLRLQNDSQKMRERFVQGYEGLLEILHSMP